jgi:hypothetical protein
MESSVPDKLRRTRYRFVDVGGVRIFCREAGLSNPRRCCCYTGFPAPRICIGS